MAATRNPTAKAARITRLNLALKPILLTPWSGRARQFGWPAARTRAAVGPYITWTIRAESALKRRPRPYSRPQSALAIRRARPITMTQRAAKRQVGGTRARSD